MDMKFFSSSISGEEPIDFSKIKDPEKIKHYEHLLQQSFNQILDAENIIILAGSGTSLAFNRKGEKYIAPSMGNLWESCQHMNPFNFDDIKNITKYDQFAAVKINKDGKPEKESNIELLLSRCDTFISLQTLA